MDGIHALSRCHQVSWLVRGHTLQQPPYLPRTAVKWEFTKGRPLSNATVEAWSQEVWCLPKSEQDPVPTELHLLRRRKAYTPWPRTSVLYSTICQSLHFLFWRPLVSGTWQCASTNVWKPLTIRDSPPELPSRLFVNLVNSVLLPKRTSVST